jgi:hypothetical protein
MLLKIVVNDNGLVCFGWVGLFGRFGLALAAGSDVLHEFLHL